MSVPVVRRNARSTDPIPLSPSLSHKFRDTRDVIESCFSIRDKLGRLVPFRFRPMQDWLYPRLTGRDLVLKNRRCGCTSLFGAMLLAWVLTREGVEAVIAAQKLETARAIKDQLIDQVFHSIPERIRPVPDRSNEYALVFKSWGSALRVVTVTKDTGRGPRATHVHFSEVAYFKASETALVETVPALEQGGWISKESTGDDPSGQFKRQVDDARAGVGPYRFHFHPWFRDVDCRIDDDAPLPTLSEEGKRAQALGADDGALKWWTMKEAEYRHDMPALLREHPPTPDDAFSVSGFPFFPKAALDRLEGRIQGAGRWPLDEPTPRMLEVLAEHGPEHVDFFRQVAGPCSVKLWEPWQEATRYAAGADVAGGVGRAASAVYVLDQHRREVAAAASDRISLHGFAHLLACLGWMYGDALLAPERNNHGHAILELLLHHYRYPNVYRHVTHLDEARGGWDVDSGTPGWPTTGGESGTRNLLFEGLLRDFEDQLTAWRSLELIQEARYIQRDGDKIVASGGTTGDRVIAAAIAVQLIQRLTYSTSDVDYDQLLVGSVTGAGGIYSRRF